MGGYMLTDALMPRQFSELTDLDYEVAELLYAAYAADGGTATISNILRSLVTATLCRLPVRNYNVYAFVLTSSAAVRQVATPYKSTC